MSAEPLLCALHAIFCFNDTKRCLPRVEDRIVMNNAEGTNMRTFRSARSKGTSASSIEATQSSNIWSLIAILILTVFSVTPDTANAQYTANQFVYIDNSNNAFVGYPYCQGQSGNAGNCDYMDTGSGTGVLTYGTGNLDVTGTAGFNNLVDGDGTQDPGILTVEGQLTASGGLTVNNNGALSINPGGAAAVSSGLSINGGATTISAGQIISGGITVDNNGSLAINQGGTANGSLSINSGIATVSGGQLSGGGVTVNTNGYLAVINNSTVTANNGISINGTAIVSGQSTLNQVATPNSLTIAGNLGVSAGSTVSASQVELQSTGSLMISDGSTVTSTGTAVVDGALSIDGNSSSWTGNSNGYIYTDAPQASIAVTNGASFTGGSLNVGAAFVSANVATTVSGGSSLNLSQAVVNPNGTLTITGGSALNISSQPPLNYGLIIYNGGSATVTDDSTATINGTVEFATSSTGLPGGTLSVSNGATLSATGGIDLTSPNGGTLVVDGGTVNAGVNPQNGQGLDLVEGNAIFTINPGQSTPLVTTAGALGLGGGGTIQINTTDLTFALNSFIPLVDSASVDLPFPTGSNIITFGSPVLDPSTGTYDYDYDFEGIVGNVIVPSLAPLSDGTQESLIPEIQQETIAGTPTDVFGLEVATSCASILQGSVTPAAGGFLSANGMPINIKATFTPDMGLSLQQAAIDCGVQGFDWEQTVLELPSPSPYLQNNNPMFLTADANSTPPVTFNDPPPGG